jgi:hypothetical protein
MASVLPGGLNVDAAQRTAAQASVRYINFVHELSADPTDSSDEQTLVIAPQRNPVLVRATSAVVAGAARQRSSPAYNAILRRRRAGVVRAMIEGLDAHAGREDFASYVYPVLDEVRSTLSLLAESEASEGNALAVLRQVRNSILDGGWRRYRVPEVRAAAVDVLARLQGEQVEPEDVTRAFDRLFGAGARPMPLFDLSDEDDEAEGEEGDGQGETQTAD